MKTVLAVLAAAVVAGALLWSPPVAAQQQIEGQVQAFDAAGKTLTLADGTKLMIPATVKVGADQLKPGAKVKVAYEEQGGQKVVKTIEMAK
jgi:hypothetical protein